VFEDSERKKEASKQTKPELISFKFLHTVEAKFILFNEREALI